MAAWTFSWPEAGLFLVLAPGLRQAEKPCTYSMFDHAGSGETWAGWLPITNDGYGEQLMYGGRNR
ncbi:hypothetical protein AG1IA_05794 [Rhizoctonia solani AG-1 IA]|uniref:Uncharacterized protein n=1 Tax=Thanatephorus cucumeris (strain AG1-IA) TaxID=983506 RepID=L8WTT5_THACA|nr:hypothetical protein AG1IA_05794 [Rhizoctonia solani AG-1 IA]